jgi:uncharacterized protein
VSERGSAHLGDVHSARWPAWFAPVGFVTGMGLAFLSAMLVSAVALAVGVDAENDPPGLTIAATVLQDVAFVATAVYFAGRIGRVTPRSFGLLPTPLRRAGAAVAVTLVQFYVVTAIYTALLDPPSEQSTLDAIGADRSAVLLGLGALLIVLAAPVAEGLFFRGFIYRALRNRFGFGVSAGAVGAVFGAIHYTGPDSVGVVAPLAVLGVLFCALYEWTGSLWPSIALHIVNNAVAYAITAERSEAPVVAAAAAAVALTVCAVGARRRR